MIVIDCEQRSEAWFEARLGKLTGSSAAAMLATIQKGEAAGRRNLRARLVLERLTGKSGEKSFESQAMRDGVEREPDALLMYEALTGQLVTRTGFIQHDTLMAGCSLDGHLGDFEGIVEAKCPIPATHLDFLESGIVPGEWLKQIVNNLWISSAAWADFISYQPDFPEPLQVRMVRVLRDEAAIAEYETKARAFLAEVDEKVAALMTKLNLAGVLRASAVA